MTQPRRRRKRKNSKKHNLTDSSYPRPWAAGGIGHLAFGSGEIAQASLEPRGDNKTVAATAERDAATAERDAAIEKMRQDKLQTVHTLKAMNLAIEQIATATGLTFEEIEKL